MLSTENHWDNGLESEIFGKPEGTLDAHNDGLLPRWLIYICYWVVLSVGPNWDLAGGSCMFHTYLGIPHLLCPTMGVSQLISQSQEHSNNDPDHDSLLNSYCQLALDRDSPAFCRPNASSYRTTFVDKLPLSFPYACDIISPRQDSHAIMTEDSPPRSMSPEPFVVTGFSFRMPQEATDEMNFWTALEGRKNLSTEWPADRICLDGFHDGDLKKPNMVSTYLDFITDLSASQWHSSADFVNSYTDEVRISSRRIHPCSTPRSSGSHQMRRLLWTQNSDGRLKPPFTHSRMVFSPNPKL